MPKPKRAKASAKVRHLPMRVIPEPAPHTRSVIVYEGPGTVAMRGTGNVTMDCGNCGSPLLVGMKTAQVRNVVFKCHKCGAFNEALV